MILPYICVGEAHREAIGSLGAGDSQRIIVHAATASAIIDTDGNHVLCVEADAILLDTDYIVANITGGREVASRAPFCLQS